MASVKITKVFLWTHACVIHVPMACGNDGAFVLACLRPCLCVLSLGGVRRVGPSALPYIVTYMRMSPCRLLDRISQMYLQKQQQRMASSMYDARVDGLQA